ncbi:hypothetical protein ZIOFF_049154 [Zingiber officinale]|uniref:Uncharacterized protein n=1 Tax=Zingiber officinale TaxID=94328 RepID=A0A8J5KUX2_ZINOF|nr:hypothetical protein ZIOFF_049154 [Zingiber officinale]
MAKHGSSKSRKPDNLGKGKVTSIQIAFIVERYLADNHFDATLAAFRSEASDLFAKTKAKEVPKGLLGLGEMLDEYISLKAQRVMLDHERRRVEMALQGMQEVLRAYHSAGTTPIPPSTHLLPTQQVAAPVTPILPTSHPSSSGSPPGTLPLAPSGNAINGIPAVKYVQPSTALIQKSPMPNSSNVNKRKSMKPSPNYPLEPKKLRTHSPNFSSAVGDVTLASKGASNTKSQEKIGISTPNAESTNLATLLSAGKSSCKQPAVCQINSSPRTPPQAFQPQLDQSGSPLENASLQTSDCAMYNQTAPSNCNIIASETIIVSPLKNAGYYAVERSYHISSPYKLNSKSKRGHIKGKLDFDNPIVTASVDEPVVGSSTLGEGELSGNLDIDLPDFSIFNGDFSFSEFLAEIGLDCEVDPSFQSCSSIVSSVTSYTDNAISGCSPSDQPDSSFSPVSDKEMNVQGEDCVGSVKAVRKFVKIVSPVKSNILAKQYT